MNIKNSNYLIIKYNFIHNCDPYLIKELNNTRGCIDYSSGSSGGKTKRKNSSLFYIIIGYKMNTDFTGTNLHATGDLRSRQNLLPFIFFPIK